ncbi:MAG: transcription termination factor Rho [Candidatus Eisenbacteria bacterium]|uniref:Transcription termination factor Rho n=1 Tax=Eiseniibacteriota bacterium TaxID=2212470 RepID=A0A933SDG0_UNCEI|nr:transcription termination factor Rho [Candidatus Eisenbacteria bacterium]
MPLFEAPAPPPAPAAPVNNESYSAPAPPSADGGATGSDAGGAPNGGGGGYDNDRGGRGRRRRRRRGGDRNDRQAGPQQGGGQPQQQNRDRGYGSGGGNDRNDRGGRGRRRRRGGSNGGGGGGGNNGGGGGRPMRRGGLEILKDMQQAGAALDPTERLILELKPGEGDPPYGDRLTGRAIDLIAPIGRGQRCLLVAPPKAGKTRILQAIAASVAHNHPDVAIYALLVDERPEEVTDFKRNTPAEVIAASSDMTIGEHIETAEHAMELVAQQVIAGKDVLLLLDSITRLARAYNAASGNGGRTMSGGLDSNAMQAPRQIFGAARKIENGGSLTIIGTALIDTGSRMDQVIFEEFKGTGNSEIYLSRELAERRIYPAIDIPKSGTRKEEKLIAPELLGTFQALRRILVQMPSQEAMLKLTDRLNKTKTNEDFFNLVRVGES